MNNSISFILGVFVGGAIGALLALLFAPQTGEELRTRLQEEASAEGQRLQARYEERKQELQARVEKAQNDLTTPTEPAEEVGDEGVETV